LPFFFHTHHCPELQQHGLQTPDKLWPASRRCIPDHVPESLALKADVDMIICNTPDKSITFTSSLSGEL